MCLFDATSRKFRHSVAIEMIRHGASFEDADAGLRNAVAVVSSFIRGIWSNVRQGKTDKGIQTTW